MGRVLLYELAPVHEHDSVGISGAGNSAMTAKFLKLGANDFLHKPFAAEEFCWRVNQTVELVELVGELTECYEKQRTQE